MLFKICQDVICVSYMAHPPIVQNYSDIVCKISTSFLMSVTPTVLIISNEISPLYVIYAVNNTLDLTNYTHNDACRICGTYPFCEHEVSQLMTLGVYILMVIVLLLKCMYNAQLAPRDYLVLYDSLEK